MYKQVFISLLFSLLALAAQSQTLKNGSYTTVGNIDNGTVKDVSYRVIGYFDNGTVKDGSYRTIGYYENGTVRMVVIVLLGIMKMAL